MKTLFLIISLLPSNAIALDCLVSPVTGQGVCLEPFQVAAIETETLFQRVSAGIAVHEAELVCGLAPPESDLDAWYAYGDCSGDYGPIDAANAYGECAGQGDMVAMRACVRTMSSNVTL